MGNRIGKQTIQFSGTPSFLSWASIAGEVEALGPLASYFDLTVDELWNEDTWEKCEAKMFEQAVRIAIEKTGMFVDDIDCLLGGDLLNQLVSINFAALALQRPFIGLYGACSTMGESLMVGAMLLDGGFANTVACVTGSHFNTAERQYRFPLELGNQRAPTAQRTVTGAGASILGMGGQIRITAATIGKVVDLGIKDAENMGAAMAPAAADTLLTHFKDTQKNPGDYDLILTGDLGRFGHDILLDMTKEAGLDLTRNYNDCGMMIFDRARQNVDSGGSGCGCSAVTLNGYILGKLSAGELKRILFMPTGALLSPTTTLQGASIPCIAHAIAIEGGVEG
ncbi:MAG: stage V sporulation protein AD [Christensenellales bacterium]